MEVVARGVRAVAENDDEFTYVVGRYWTNYCNKYT